MLTITFDKYIISFNVNNDNHTFVDNDVEKLVSVSCGDTLYEIHYNKQVHWGRINIRNKSSFKDLPLNENTIKLLPFVVNCEQR